VSLALYRKYRPATFAEVVGQEHVTEPLAQALRTGRVHHAYLFTGPRGCGKTSSARILARSLNCAQGPTPTPCGTCDSCRALAPNGAGSIDVIEIDAASHGGVDEARDLRERAFYAPVASRYKVYIVDEAHMVSREGFNALLKLVEEPPPHLKFVFATTEPERVIATIRSRTHTYSFRLLPPAVLREFLAGICLREGVEVDPLVLPLVVRAGGGSARDALSVLDQLAAGSGPEGVTYASALALLGYTDAALLDEVVDAVAAADGAAVFEAVERLVDSGSDPRRFTADLLERFRDMLILAAVPGAGEKGLLDVSGDQLERMEGQAARFGQADLSRCADLLAAGLTEMRGTAPPRLLLELLCARLLLPAASEDPASLRVRLDRLERRLEVGTQSPTGTARRPSEPPGRSAQRVPGVPPAAPGSAPTTQDASTALPAETAAAPATRDGGLSYDAVAVRRLWPDILDAVKSRRRTPHALLSQHAQVTEVAGRTITLAFDVAPLKRTFSVGANLDVLREALREVLGGEWQVELRDGAPDASREMSADSSPGRAGVPAAAVEPDPDTDDELVEPSEDAVALVRRGLGARVIEE
jgi:DNA polymerase III subunit gamma/tau